MKAGERGKAKGLLIEFLRQNPNDEQAWILLSRCVTSRQQKLFCLNTVLEMNPNNQTARRALHTLQSKSKPKHSRKNMYLFGTVALGLVLVLGSFTLVSIYKDENAAPAAFEEIVIAPDTSNQVHPLVYKAGAIDENLTFDSEDNLTSFSPETENVPLPDVPETFCVPNDTNREIGEVIQVITPDVIIVDLAGEQVRVNYIGLDTSTLETDVYAQALETNRTLEGQYVILVQDVTDSTPDGNHPRYVFIGDTFVNYQLLDWGLGIPVNSPPDDSCIGFFLVAQTNAQDQKVGAWAPPLPEEWKEWRVIPEINDHAQLVYLTGLANGNNSRSFSVIGDCQSLPWRFLGRVDWDSYKLPEGYTYLQPTIDWFAGDYSRDFVSVRDNATVATMFSALWADPNQCKSTETPLECEFRLNNPSIVLISLGTNWGNRSPEEFEHYLREIVQFSLDRNVLPIIATKADATASDYPLNYAMARVAYDYDIPLWNFWGVVQYMPFQGMDPEDDRGIHILSGAYPYKRITAIQVLHEVRTTIEELAP
jgi:endonuclease YncB( thermonuclease family)